MSGDDTLRGYGEGMIGPLPPDVAVAFHDMNGACALSIWRDAAAQAAGPLAPGARNLSVALAEDGDLSPDDVGLLRCALDHGMSVTIVIPACVVAAKMAANPLMFMHAAGCA